MWHSTEMSSRVLIRHIVVQMFVCVKVLRPSQPNGANVTKIKINYHQNYRSRFFCFDNFEIYYKAKTVTMKEKEIKVSSFPYSDQI